MNPDQHLSATETADASVPPYPTVEWTEAGARHQARWRSEAGLPAPKRLQVVDDTLKADTAYRLACEGTALLWRGDFQNGRMLLSALARRIDRKAKRSGGSAAESFHLHRQALGQRARILSMVLIPVTGDFSIPLRRAPDVQQACGEVWSTGSADSAPSLVSLRELLGLIGAHEWRRKGVEILQLGERIHPHYGVFSPIRGEYLDLVANTSLPGTATGTAPELAFDIGTGTGVIAALLAKRGIKRVIATDSDPRALVCAKDNLTRLGLTSVVTLSATDMFPTGCAPLVVCNPPWLPARPSSPVENAVYDPDCRMLKAFLSGLTSHLTDDGEGWLILSDLAEHLGLRSRAELTGWIAAGGLQIIARHDIKPRHPKAGDQADPLHFARSAEVTSLWRLGKVPGR